MLQSMSSLRNAVLAAVVVAVAATPALAQRSYRGGYQDAGGRYHSGNEDFGETFYGGNYSPWSPRYGYAADYPSYWNNFPNYPTYRSGTPYYSSPSYYYPTAPMTAQPSYSYYYTPADTANDTSATVRVRVPSNAQIWFDDQPTLQTGERRTFNSPPLESGQKYHYTVRAKWEDDKGKMQEQTKRVDVSAGKTADVDFTRP